MVKTMALLALAAIAAVLVLAAMKPAGFRVERSIRIQAPPERVFGFIDDLGRMKAWNPYERKDPALRGNFGARTAGPGASYAWESDKVGAGSMTIVESTAPSRITMRLDFLKPFAATNTAEYTLRPEAGGTQVSWAMHGPNTFLSKLMQVFFSFDTMIGKDFEDGLNNLKALAEAKT